MTGEGRAEPSLPAAADEPLERLLPPVRRARGYRLYDLRGRRYLDLYLSGGRALLGHRPARTLLELKNLVSRGLLSELPSTFERRLAKALALLLPGYPVVRVYANEERLTAAVGALPELCLADRPAGGDAHPLRPVIAETLASEGEVGRLRRWRPCAGVEFAAPEGASAVVPVLPFPGSFAPVVACLRGVDHSRVPPSDVVSPALLGALTRSVYDLLEFVRSDHETAWARFEAPWWTRTGPYLFPRCEKREYSEIFRRLLEGGILINPYFPGPSIAASEYTAGELKPLRTLARQWRGRP